MQDMNNNIALAVADLTIAAEGELYDMDAILSSDPDFQAHMDSREAEALAYQMENE